LQAWENAFFVASSWAMMEMAFLALDKRTKHASTAAEQYVEET